METIDSTFVLLIPPIPSAQNAKLEIMTTKDFLGIISEFQMLSGDQPTTQSTQVDIVDRYKTGGLKNRHTQTLITEKKDFGCNYKSQTVEDLTQLHVHAVSGHNKISCKQSSIVLPVQRASSSLKKTLKRSRSTSDDHSLGNISRSNDEISQMNERLLPKDQFDFIKSRLESLQNLLMHMRQVWPSSLTSMALRYLKHVVQTVRQLTIDNLSTVKKKEEIKRQDQFEHDPRWKHALGQDMDQNESVASNVNATSVNAQKPNADWKSKKLLKHGSQKIAVVKSWDGVSPRAENTDQKTSSATVLPQSQTKTKDNEEAQKTIEHRHSSNGEPRYKIRRSHSPPQQSISTTRTPSPVLLKNVSPSSSSSNHHPTFKFGHSNRYQRPTENHESRHQTSYREKLPGTGDISRDPRLQSRNYSGKEALKKISSPQFSCTRPIRPRSLSCDVDWKMTSHSSNMTSSTKLSSVFTPDSRTSKERCNGETQNPSKQFYDKPECNIRVQGSYSQPGSRISTHISQRHDQSGNSAQYF